MTPLEAWDPIIWRANQRCAFETGFSLEWDVVGETLVGKLELHRGTIELIVTGERFLPAGPDLIAEYKVAITGGDWSDAHRVEDLPEAISDMLDVALDAMFEHRVRA